MKRFAAAAVIISLGWAGTASAGAWLRDKGSGFFSATIDIDAAANGTLGSYFEYGLSDAMTVGADVNMPLDPAGGGDGHAGLFLRRALGPTDRTSRWAWQAGAGAAWSAAADGTTQFTAYAEGGLSWGRGIKLGDKYGWVAIDGAARFDAMTSDHRIKIDTTVGLGLTERTKGMIQVFLTHENGALTSKLAPSVLFQPVKDGKYTFQLGAEIPSSGGGDATLKLGLWREF